MKTATQKKTAKKSEPTPQKVLVVDIGGTKVKLLATGHTEPRKFPSGKKMTPQHLVELIKTHAKDWEYEAVSIGYPGQVGSNGPRSEPGNLGPGWVGYDFAAALERPIRVINDAAMQALGSYDGGRMLFLGLGTGLGSALIADYVIVPLELGRVPCRDSRLGDHLGRSGLRELGKNEWRSLATETMAWLMEAFLADYLVVGGGNAKVLKELPPGIRRGHNATAFRGGFRLWSLQDVATLSTDNGHVLALPPAGQWRMI